jgi:chromosome segregation protein
MLSRIENERSIIIDELEGVLELQPETDEDNSLTLPFFVKLEQLDTPKLHQEWKGKFNNYSERLTAIGEVNFLAIGEHHELKKQYDALVDQKSDLENSAKQITNVINELNEICSVRFLDAVASVDKAFQDIYPRLVGGGSSYIKLLDEEAPLKSGVLIFAQPPGKKLDRLSLLSGGERAMVAISLLFALFRVKPSPICLLDEVDAPLDEGNGGRFNLMLKEMAAAAQFIVITHNKKTMEVVDVLYGVSMPTSGVSQLVSVRLE